MALIMTWRQIQNSWKTENTLNTDRQKNSFPKQKVENADLDKHAVKK